MALCNGNLKVGFLLENVEFPLDLWKLHLTVNGFSQPDIILKHSRREA